MFPSPIENSQNVGMRRVGIIVEFLYAPEAPAGASAYRPHDDRLQRRERTGGDHRSPDAVLPGFISIRPLAPLRGTGEQIDHMIDFPEISILWGCQLIERHDGVLLSGHGWRARHAVTGSAHTPRCNFMILRNNANKGYPGIERLGLAPRISEDTPKVRANPSRPAGVIATARVSRWRAIH
jgi:hypothetical protein